MVALTLGTIICAAVSYALAPMTGLLLLLPACGLFFFLVVRLLQDWRTQLLEAWIKKDIDFRAFSEAVNAVPKLPKDTLRGMLATLPSARDLTSEQKTSSSTREAVAEAVAGIHACQSDAVALRVAAAAIVSGSVIISAAIREWEPMSGSAALILLPLFGKWLRRRRVEKMKERTLAALEKPDFNSEKYRELVERLQWHPISKSEKDRLVKSGFQN